LPSLLVCATFLPAQIAGLRFTFHVLGDEPGAWPELLSAVGMVAGPASGASVVVVPHGTDLPVEEWLSRVDQGTLLVLEGESPLADTLGFRRSSEPLLPVRNVEDLRNPEIRIIWEKSVDLPIFQVPAQARVFARERWKKAPLIAGYRRGAGAVLWVAASLGAHAYDRFPYLLHALADLGLNPPFRTRRLWAFFDSAYRSRVDLDYFAARWRAAAWHFWERDPQNDEYLRRLIDACHRNAILVYAWLELPHVSERIWADHPDWREKTALLQDAQLDWRKLMNLSRPDAFAAVSQGLDELLVGFDWDGANLAELYFESLEGAANPARFTPMNGNVREEFRREAGFDPLELFQSGSPRYWSRDRAALVRFLDYRADLARRQQSAWIGEIERIRKKKPHLDLALTHIDDRFDPSMRDKLGADTSRVLPLLAEHDFTFLIEDPATIWNQGPGRYPEIAARYTPLTPAQEKLAIDINIVDRYQDVYPTKPLAGAELLETVHKASAAFPRVALYFESSISREDVPLLAPAAAAVDHVTEIERRLIVQSKYGVGIPWTVPATVNGKPWPVADGLLVWLPSGRHVLEAATEPPAARILDFNGDLRDASVRPDGDIEFLYESASRALAVLDVDVESLEIDGKTAAPEMLGRTLLLPPGEHSVVARKRRRPKPQPAPKYTNRAINSAAIK
jgi:hypothetical protein